ncbi:MAG: DUF742 domain-containing protein [Sciscionella sp.]|nr:DUF742 domain-containing protein [Sciscionella sp.]
MPAEQSWPRTETPSLRRDAALVDTGVQSLQHEEFDDEASLVRPYAWTRGRTKSSLDLELETLVSTRDQAEIPRMTQLEHRSIAQLCRHPHSVAEVAAKLHVPLGVARVLLSDMAEVGLIIVHQTVADNDMAAHLILMERVLSGLRRL